jgi:aspartyl-tRNA(Asn)/glutamyl-tRNA(Gln) amidotransferase subunit C
MALGSEDVKKIAHLARLSIDSQDVDHYAKNLSDILEMVEQMNNVDTDGVTPMAHPQDAMQRLRPDEVSEPDARDAFQAIAPRAEAGLYLVPKVIE